MLSSHTADAQQINDTGEDKYIWHFPKILRRRNLSAVYI